MNDVRPAREYYHRDGMELRPAPRRDHPTWPYLRHYLFDAWMAVPDGWESTEQTRLLDDHMWEGDEVMDGVVEMFVRLGPRTGRAMFHQALDHGITSVPDAPPELVRLFRQLDRLPDWYDARAAERGRLRLCLATDAAKTAARAFGVFATAMEEDVSASTGATGRIIHAPVARALESYEFFYAITHRGALTPGSEVFKTVLQVRLMHAQVRRGLRRKWGDGNYAEHGMPISNTNLAAGSAWFGSMSVLIDHCLGRPLAVDELDDISIHWGYILYLFGVAERIIPTTADRSVRLANHVFASAGEPSRWRPRLAEGLLDPMTINGAAGDEAVGMYLGAAAMVLGVSEVEGLVADTRFADVPIAEYRDRFEERARDQAREAHRHDEDPDARRRDEIAASESDPFLAARGKDLRAASSARGVHAVVFDHHDASVEGAHLGSP